MAEFFAMGGYAAYVWSAFGFAAVSMLGLLWQSWATARKRARELSELEARLGSRRERRARPRKAMTPTRGDSGTPGRADAFPAPRSSPG